MKNNNSLPNQKIIDYHKDRGQKFQKTYEKVLKSFKEKDKVLGKWFKEIKTNLENTGKKLPSYDLFKAVYQREITNLVSYYVNKSRLKIVSGDGNMDFDVDITNMSNKEKNIRSILPLPKSNEVRASTMRIIQDKYWVVQKFLEVFEQSPLEKLSKFEIIKWNLPEEDFFSRRVFRITGQIKYSKTILLVQKLLNNPYFLTEVSDIEISRNLNYVSPTIKIKVKWNQSEEEALKEFVQQNPDKVKLPLITIKIKFSILDYKVKN